ncbi:MAG: hypothetical protein KC615_15695 [Anaerolineae bacterium]|nr:hypothetical protein [Anaerolineae bacterium]
MPHEITWLLPERVLQMRVWGKVTRDELVQIGQTMTAHLEGVNGKIDWVVDDSNQEELPIQLSDLRRDLSFFRHDSMRWIVAVGKTSPVVNLAIPIVASLMRVQLKRFPTMEGALDFLNKQDPSLAFDSLKLAEE